MYRGEILIEGAAAQTCSVELADSHISIVPATSTPIYLPYVDIDDLFDDNYTLRLADHTGQRYGLSMLGKAYGQVLGELRKARNHALERDLLLRGVSMQDTFTGKLFGGDSPVPVEIRLYEDLLVVVPERGTMFGVPFSFVERVEWDQELYQTTVVTDDGRRLVFGHLAKRSEEFRDEVMRLLARLGSRTARTLTQLLPGVEPSLLSRLSERMRDGRAVQRRAIDEFGPTLWPRLEDAVVRDAGLRSAYEHLAAMTPPGWAAFGIKAVLSATDDETPAPRRTWEQPTGGATRRESRSEWRERWKGTGGEPYDLGAAAEPAGPGSGGIGGATSAGTNPSADDGAAEPGDERPETDLWYFCPLSAHGEPINAVAHEVTSEKGHATYLFRLMEPERFSALGGDALAAEVGLAIARLNRALLLLNFRREPLYASEEEIATGRFARYRVALRKLDYLRWARANLLGRAIHNSTWEQQVEDIAARV